MLTRLSNLSPEAAGLCRPAIAAADDAANWGPAIDNTLLLLGVAYEEIGSGACPAGREREGIAILRMYGLELLAERLAGNVSNDVSGATDTIREARSNVLAQVREQWVDAVKRVEAMGYQVERAGAAYWDVQLDIYEPEL
jgi:hypothetical protein